MEEYKILLSIKAKEDYKNIIFYIKNQLSEPTIARKYAELIKEVDGVTDEIMALGTDASEGGRGGMRTKLEAAKLVTRFGGKVLIANGKIPYVISKIFDKEDIGTMFLPKAHIPQNQSPVQADQRY